MGTGELLIDAEGVCKTFCKDLKRSLWYGLTDIASAFIGKASPHVALRTGEFWALQDINLKLHRGEAVGLIGPNGAGKTTFLRMINGLIRPDCGSLRVRGRIGAMIALGTGFNPLLSGRDNIYLSASIQGLSPRDTRARLAEIIDFAELGDFIDSPVRSYSSGMVVRLGFSVAAHLYPDILLIDEVLAVGDVRFRMRCFQHLQKLLNDGTSMIFVTHNLLDLYRVATRGVTFNKGRIVCNATVSEAARTYDRLMLEKRLTGPNDSPAAISAVSIKDGSGATDCFSTGSEITVNVQIDAREMVSHARVIIAFEAAVLGEVASTSNGQTGTTVCLRPGSNEVRLKVHNFPFLEGSYQVSVSLYGPAVEDFFDRWIGAVGFSVAGPAIDPFGYGRCGIVALDVHWSSKV